MASEGDAWVFAREFHTSFEVLAEATNGTSVAVIDPIIAFNNNWSCGTHNSYVEFGAGWRKQFGSARDITINVAEELLPDEQGIKLSRPSRVVFGREFQRCLSGDVERNQRLLRSTSGGDYRGCDGRRRWNQIPLMMNKGAKRKNTQKEGSAMWGRMVQKKNWFLNLGALIL